jgi:hypothetical protein
MEGATTQSPNGVLLPKYEKPKGWTTLTDTEKIERLREIIKQKTYFENMVYELQNKVQKLRQLLVKHSHNGTDVVSKVEEYDNLNSGYAIGSLNSSNENPDEVFF